MTMTATQDTTFTPPEGMEVVYSRPITLAEKHTHYCPGCTHGIAHRLVAEALDELDLLGDAIIVAPVGCSVFAYQYFNVDGAEAAHGRAPAMATGLKRIQPENIVITYQGDGDLASIGAAEILHAAVRGEKITTVFINNAIYGMTGGQMAPTTLVGQKTTSSPALSSWVSEPRGQNASLSSVAGLTTSMVPVPSTSSPLMSSLKSSIGFDAPVVSAGSQ